MQNFHWQEMPQLFQHLPVLPIVFARSKPSLISLSYFSLTPAVMSVRMIPVLLQNRDIKFTQRTANNCVAMLKPAFEIQYSPRLPRQRLPTWKKY
jgi:hypothetical protein